MESFLWLMVITIAYFAPTWTAPKGRRLSVFVINLFLGWTVIFWIVALWLAIRARETVESQKGGA